MPMPFPENSVMVFTAQVWVPGKPSNHVTTLKVFALSAYAIGIQLIDDTFDGIPIESNAVDTQMNEIDSNNVVVQMELGSFIRLLLQGDIMAVQVMTQPICVVDGQEGWNDIRDKVAGSTGSTTIDASSNNNLGDLRGSKFLKRCLGIAQGALLKSPTDSDSDKVRIDAAFSLLDNVVLPGLLESNHQHSDSINEAVNDLSSTVFELLPVKSARTTSRDIKNAFYKFRAFVSKLEENAHKECLGKQSEQIAKQQALGITRDLVEAMYEYVDEMRWEQEGEHNSHEVPASFSSTRYPTKLRDLAEQLSLPFPLDSLLFVTQTGSWMYGLNVAASDTDYAVVFRTPTKEAVSMCPPSNCFSKIVQLPFGSNKQGEVDYAGKEVIKFASEILRGSVPNFELLFFQGCIYASPLWKELVAIRADFLSVAMIGHYFGFVINRCGKLTRIQKRLASDDDETSATLRTPEEIELDVAAARKLLYQVHHKLKDLARLVTYQLPHVRLVGQELQDVRDIRDQETTPATAFAQLYADAENEFIRLKELRKTVRAHRVSQGLYVYPKTAEISRLKAWAYSVRFGAGVRRRQELGTRGGDVRTGVCAGSDDIDGVDGGGGSVDADPDVGAGTDGTGVGIGEGLAGVHAQTIDEWEEQEQEEQEQEEQEQEEQEQEEQEQEEQEQEGEEGEEEEEQQQQQNRVTGQLHRDTIESCLQEIEQDNELRIVFASEHSSRVFGYSTPQSDHDIIAIFVQSRATYFGMIPITKTVRKQFVVNVGGLTNDDHDDNKAARSITIQKDVRNTNESLIEIDVTLFEARHAFGLMCTNNPSMLEAFHSPLVYRELGTWAGVVRQTMLERYDRLGLAMSWLSHAKTNFEMSIERKSDTEVVRKKYLHVLRPIFYLEWFERVWCGSENDANYIPQTAGSGYVKCNGSIHSSSSGGARGQILKTRTRLPKKAAWPTFDMFQLKEQNLKQLDVPMLPLNEMVGGKTGRVLELDKWLKERLKHFRNLLNFKQKVERIDREKESAGGGARAGTVLKLKPPTKGLARSTSVFMSWNEILVVMLEDHAW